MPSTPKPWLTLQAIAASLQKIRTPTYWSDLGATVSLEKTQSAADGSLEEITLYSSALSRPEEAQNQNAAIKTREFEFIIEVTAPIKMSNGVVPAHERIHQLIEDIERALEVDEDGNAASVASTPGAIPAQFREVVFADRPAGLQAIVAQYIMAGKYRRAR
jgi:hypothetical protein